MAAEPPDELHVGRPAVGGEEELNDVGGGEEGGGHGLRSLHWPLSLRQRSWLEFLSLSLFSLERRPSFVHLFVRRLQVPFL